MDNFLNKVFSYKKRQDRNTIFFSYVKQRLSDKYLSIENCLFYSKNTKKPVSKITMKIRNFVAETQNRA